jgi:GxxExxY protein
VVDICYKIHTKLGPGLLESVYEAILYYELNKLGLKVEKQKPLPVHWDEMVLEIGFRADLIVEDKVNLEIKSVAELANVHPKQVLTYLRITDMKLGLLINFNETYIKDGIKRVVNNL